MKLNIACSETGGLKTIEVDDEKKLIPFLDKRIGAEVGADSLGDEWKGYLLKITGGNDKQGFPMLQGVLTNNRVRLLFRKGMKCFRERRSGQRKRKSVRGCIVGMDIAALNLCVAKKGDKDIEGLTDEARPRRLGPKIANKIRKMFNLPKEDDVRKFVVRRVIKEGKTKAPKIQRLVTDTRVARKKSRLEEVRNRRIKASKDRVEYRAMLAKYKADKQQKQLESLAKKKKKMEKKQEAASKSVQK